MFRQPAFGQNLPHPATEQTLVGFPTLANPPQFWEEPIQSKEGLGATVTRCKPRDDADSKHQPKDNPAEKPEVGILSQPGIAEHESCTQDGNEGNE